MSGTQPVMCPGKNNACKDQRQQSWIWQFNKRAMTSLHETNRPDSLYPKVYGIHCKGLQTFVLLLSLSSAVWNCMVGLDVLPRSWRRLINNNGEIRGTSLVGYLYPQSKFNLDLLSTVTTLAFLKTSQTSYFHTSLSSHNSDLDMKYLNAALPAVIGSEIPHHKLRRLCALCFREEVASTCELVHVGSAKTPGRLSCVFTSYCIMRGFGQTLEEHEEQQTNLFWWENTFICVSVRCACMWKSAQVCRGSRAGRRTDRRTGCLWGQGLGGVLAGTTPDSNWVDAPWQFCTFMSLLIKVSTCWAGETTVPVPPGPPYRTRRGGWEHFLPPVLPCPSNAHWADKSGQLWWPLVGQGWRCQPCQRQRWEQSYMAPPDLGSEKRNLDASLRVV